GRSVDDVDRADLAGTSVPPTGAVLDEVLRPGDLLYIPRGCYHLAIPINEPALHLTLGVKNPRGSDVLLWIVDRLRANDVFASDLPLLGDDDERRRYSERLRRALIEALDGDLVERYVADTGSNLKPRPSFDLPWSATPDGLPPGRDFLVTLKSRAAIVPNGASDGSIEVECSGRTYRFPRGMGWLIDRLDAGASLSIGRVIDAGSGTLDEAMVRTLVAMLLTHDLVAI